MSLDDFIDAALDYASGKTANSNSNIVVLKDISYRQEEKLVNGNNAKMQHCTFTLSSEAKRRLDYLASKTGISRSRLIRIWLAPDLSEAQFNEFMESKVK